MPSILYQKVHVACQHSMRRDDPSMGQRWRRDLGEDMVGIGKKFGARYLHCTFRTSFALTCIYFTRNNAGGVHGNTGGRGCCEVPIQNRRMETAPSREWHCQKGGMMLQFVFTTRATCGQNKRLYTAQSLT